jgi:hypothetical protein
MAAGVYWASAGLALVVLVLALDIMGLFSSKTHFDVDGRVRHSLRRCRWQHYCNSN